MTNGDGTDPWGSWRTLFWVVLWAVFFTCLAIGLIEGKVKL